MIFSEGLVVPMPVSAAVGSGLGLKWRGFLVHRHPKLHQHLLQDRVGLELKEVFSEFDRRMPVSQMVRGAHQGVRRFSGNQQHIFRGRFDSDQGAVLCLQKIAVAQHRSARQEKGGFNSVRERRSKPAPAPKIEWQHKLRETMYFSFGYFAIGVSFDSQHGGHLLQESGDIQNRKYRCAIGKIFAGSQVRSSPSATTW
jgi:hypothetical protein